MKKFALICLTIFYFFAFSFFIFLYTFPYNSLTFYLNSVLKEKTSGKIEIKSVSYHFPVNFNINIKIHLNQRYLNIDDNFLITLSPGLFKITTLFIDVYHRDKKIIYANTVFNRIIKKPVIQKIDIYINDFDIYSISIYNNISLKGKINGLIKINKNNLNYMTKTSIKGLKILVNAYGFKRLIPINIDDIETNVFKTKVHIKGFKITSPYFKIDGRGSIFLKKNIMDSIISIKGKINLNLTNIKKDLISFPFNNKSSMKYSVFGSIGSIKYKIYN